MQGLIPAGGPLDPSHGPDVWDKEGGLNGPRQPQGLVTPPQNSMVCSSEVRLRGFWLGANL